MIAGDVKGEDWNVVRQRLADALNDHNSFDRGCAWIQGEFVPIRDARIPLLDAGFSRSDVTYDVVAVWGGTFFRLDVHLD